MLRLCLGVCALLFAQSALAGLITSLSMQSETGDFVGAGQNYFYDLSDGTFDADVNLDNGVNIDFTGSGGDFWFLSFAAPFDASLVVGSYENAERFPFQLSDKPGLSASGNGRGCNTLTGRFDVLDISINAGVVESFSADFEQHCEGGDPALFGQIRYNAAMVPEPATLTLMGLGIAGLGFRRKAK